MLRLFRPGSALRPISTMLPTSGCALLLACIAVQPAAAQQPASAPPAVQPVPSREALELSAALSRLSRDPRNVEALIAAGNAASKLGDFEAAAGFFKRGQALAPSNPGLLAGLAGALVRQGDAVAALPLFAQAQAAGAPVQSIAADRGLAHDLVGDPASAQRFYAQALTAGGDASEVILRLAISQAISGDGSAMERTLMPLLRKQDKPAWRARAFGLAILGQGKEANRIVKTLLPGQLADGITPYLEYMPRLTQAQQAAAANLGIFPRASEIGRDETRLAALSRSAAGRDTGKGLVPSGRPLGPGESDARASSSRTARQMAKEAEAKARREAKLAEEQKRQEVRLARESRKERRVAPPEPRPTREDVVRGETAFSLPSEAPVPKVAAILEGKVPSAASKPAEVPPPVAAPVPPAAAAQPAPAPAVQVAAVQVAARPLPPPAPAPAPTRVALDGFDLARLPASMAGPAAQDPAPATAQAELPPATAPAASPPQAGGGSSFGALFADLGKPAAIVTPAEGAVDIRKIEPARPQPKPKTKPKPKPEPEAKKAAPSHPSRIWVQLGIGQKVSALTQDWRRKEKANPALFKGRKPFSARLNQTNRLLTGPFASQKEASKFIDALEKAGVAGPYIWTSPAGEVVDDLPR